MNEETRNRLVREGVLALDALTQWFRAGREPTAENLDALLLLGVISRDGLTEEGIRFLREPECQPSGLKVYSVDVKEEGIRFVRDLDCQSKPSGRAKPSQEEVERFGRIVAKKIGETCLTCHGQGFVFKPGYGLVVCPDCRKKGKNS